MVARQKILEQVLRGTADANIQFHAVCALLRSLGFEERTKGSPHVFTREGVSEILNLQPKGAKAKAYQVRQVRDVILITGLQEAAMKSEPRYEVIIKPLASETIES